MVVVFIVINRDQTLMHVIGFTAGVALWVALTISAAGGFIAGYLIGRKRERNESGDNQGAGHSPDRPGGSSRHGYDPSARPVTRAKGGFDLGLTVSMRPEGSWLGDVAGLRFRDRQ